MKSIILTMSLMGSTMFLAYLILCPLLNRFFSTGIRIKFLLASMFFYLFPLPLIKNYYYDLVSMFYSFSLTDLTKIELMDNLLIIKMPDGSIKLPNISMTLLSVTLFWIVILAVMAIIKYRQYNKFSGNINKTTKNNVDDSIEEDIILYKNKLKIKRNISILSSDTYETLTLGFFKPRVLINSSTEKTYAKFIINHELAHIKHNDFIIKLVMLAVCVLHWFNPLVYIMAFILNQQLEYYADETAVMELNKDEKKLYGEAIINSAVKKKAYGNNMPVSTFASKDYKTMKGRLKEMKNTKKHSLFNYIIASALLAFVIIANSMIVFAYEDYQVENIDSIEEYNSQYSEVADEVYFIPDGVEDPFAAPIYEFPDGVDSIFIDENGNVIPINDDEASPHALCNHTYTSGKKSNHYPNSSGGCTVKTYNCQYCTKCGETILGSLISTNTYTVCPH